MILPLDGPLQERQLLPIVTGLLGTSVPTLSIPSVSIPPLPSIVPLSSLLPGPTPSASSLSSSSSPSSVSSTSAASTVSSTTSTTSSTAKPSTTSSESYYQVTTSGGSTITVVVNPTSNPTPITPSASSFLENKTATGIVFAIVGVVALALIIITATFIIRRRNRNKLDDAISFDPGINAERGSIEKASIRSSGSNRNVQPYGFHRQYYSPGTMAPNYPRS